MAEAIGTIYTEEKDGEKMMVIDFGRLVTKARFDIRDVKYMQRALEVVLEKWDEK